MNEKCRMCGSMFFRENKEKMRLCPECLRQYRRNYKRMNKYHAPRRQCESCKETKHIARSFKKDLDICDACARELDKIHDESPARFSDCKSYRKCLDKAAISNKKFSCENCRFYQKETDIHLRENPYYMQRTVSSNGAASRILNSEFLKRKINELRYSGNSINEIAAAYGVDEKVIQNVTKDINRKKRESVKLDEIKAFLKRGWKVVEIARHYDVSDVTIHRRIEAAGLKA